MKVDLISFIQSCIFRAQLPRPMRNKVREGSYEIRGKSHPASSWWEKNPVRIKSLEGWAQTGLWGRCYVLVSYQWWVEGTALFWVLGGAASNSCSPPKFSWPPEVWKRLYSLKVGVLEWQAPEIWRAGWHWSRVCCHLGKLSHRVWSRTCCRKPSRGSGALSFHIPIVWPTHTRVYRLMCKEGDWGVDGLLAKAFEIFPLGQQISVSTRLWPGNNSYVYIVFIEFLWHARHLIRITSFNVHYNLIRMEPCLSTFYGGENRGLENLNSLSKLTKLLSGKSGILIEAISLWSPCIYQENWTTSLHVVSVPVTC